MTGNWDAPKEWYHAHEVMTRMIVLGVLLLAVLAAFAWQRHKYAQLEQRYHAVALKASNDSARADTTRAVLFSARDSAKFLGDSLKAVTRLVEQLKPERDVLDRTLEQVRTSNTQLAAKVKALAVTTSSTTPVHTDSADTRSATFHVDSTPYHVNAAVSLPKIGAGTIALGVKLDPAKITVRMGCETTPNENGIRMARVSILSPPWLSLTVDKAEQDDQVCNLTQKKGRGWWGFPSLLAGAGWTVNAHGSGLGGFVGVGLRVGP